MSSQASPLVAGDIHVGQLTIERTDTMEPEQLHAVAPMKLFGDVKYSIGRDPKSEIQLKSNIVSSSHFGIYSIIYDIDEKDYDPNVYCEDLGSLNGTWVNDVFIGCFGSARKAYLLSDGDVIRIEPHWAFRFNAPTESNSQEKKSIQLESLQMREMEVFDELYRISDRVLGAGEYGKVYLGQDNITGQQLACKIVKRHRPGNARKLKTKTGEDLDDKVLHEVYILSELDHVNIMRLTKAYYSEHTLYAFFELGVGGDLFSYMMSKGGSLDELDSRVVTFQVANALEYLHGKGFAHRDIKPENILLTGTDVGHRILLSDFGAARVFTAAGAKMMSQVGTTGYVAPEVYTRSGYTEMADIYSFGQVLICMLTGSNFFEKLGNPTQAETSQFLDDPNTWMQEPWSKISSRPKALMIAMLAAAPENRPAVGEILKDEWFTKYKAMVDALKECKKQYSLCWKPRRDTFNLIQELPNFRQPKPKTPRRGRYKIPDATASPYFGLEKHLTPRRAPQSQAILDNLENSGSKFIGGTSPTPTAARYYTRSSQKQIRDVDANDIFAPTKPKDLRARLFGIDRMISESHTDLRNPQKSFDSSPDPFGLSTDNIRSRNPSKPGGHIEAANEDDIETEDDDEDTRIADDFHPEPSAITNMSSVLSSEPSKKTRIMKSWN